jgi:murein DD-endopeptidase MepM/ murein hydrolase activator NlpD
MRSGSGCERLQTVSRAALVALICGLSAACSSDTKRFADSTFSNPFSQSSPAAEPAAMGAVASAEEPGQPAAMPSSRVASAPLAAPAATRIAAAPVPGASSHALPTSTRAGGWTAQGGSSITVSQGDSLDTIANRYGVPPRAIVTANNLSGAGQVTPGRRLVIPVYNANGTDVASPAPVRSAAAAHPAAEGKVVAKYRLAEGPKPAAATGEAKSRTRPGQVAAKTPEPARAPQKLAAAEPAKPVRQTRPVAAAEPKAQPAPKVAQPERVAALSPAPQKAVAPPPVTEAPKPAKEPEATGALTHGADFRWPARGRVISGFGGSNEGINIAVPDGTPVKAAEAGTVAYAGSEVKGYGNLVLVRHDNGYVSAYAHNGDIEVKRGDKVKRGQVIAKSGQSGNVTSPQLHFEIRKGSTPVDPTPFLASN